jgi:hypothetical protein
VSLILDAGALIAVERGDRELDVLLKRELLASRIPATHGGVIGQVWRGGSGQVRLARLLPGITVEPLTGALGKRAGALLARARRRDVDVIDAALVLLASDGDWILTSDPDDIVPLAEAARLHVDIIEI